MSAKPLYLRVRGKVLGPFTLAQLANLRDRGQFRSFHEVSEDRVGWQSASTLQGMFPAGEVARGQGRLPENGSRSATRVERKRQQPAEWHFAARDGSEQGPITAAQLLRLFQNGTVDRRTQVWREGMEEWAELSQTELATRLEETRERGDGVSAAVSPVMHFFANPVSGLPRIAAALSPTNAIGLALSFYLAAVSLVVLSIILSEIVHKSQVFAYIQRIANAPDRFEIIAKLLVVTLLPFASLWLTLTLLRLVTRSWGHYASDGLIAAAVLLSSSVLAPFLVLAWGVSFEVVLFLLWLNLMINVLQLYAAFSQTLKLPDQGCLFAIPSALFLNFWLQVTMLKVLFRIELPWWLW